MKSEYNNDDDLEKMAPGLSQVKKENPFKVPEDYFTGLPNSILQKIEALPDLEKLNKANPYQVPDDYFDSIPSAVQQRIIEEKNKKRFFRGWASISFRPAYALALVVVVVLVAFGIRFFTKPSDLQAPENYFSLEEIQNSACFAELDEAAIVDVLEQQNKNTTTEDDNSLEQYLIDNNIDISQIENRL